MLHDTLDRGGDGVLHLLADRAFDIAWQTTAVDNLQVVIQVASIVKLLGMADRGSFLETGSLYPASTGCPDCRQFRERLLDGGYFLFYDEFMNPELREKGYIPSKGLLEPSLARVIYKTLLLTQWRGECFRDNHIPTAASVVQRRADRRLAAGAATEDRGDLRLSPGAHLQLCASVLPWRHLHQTPRSGKLRGERVDSPRQGWG